MTAPDALTDDDREHLVAIRDATDDRTRARLIRDYWHDGDRADRTPPGFAYLHLGILSGTIDRLVEPPAPTTAMLALLRRYLDNHSANADAEGMGALCECRLCLATRALTEPAP